MLEEAGILSDRFRMPNKPPWDYEDFVADDPTFLTRYLEGRSTEVPQAKVAVIQNPYLFTVNFEDDQNGFIAGLGGVILRSADGGRTWRYAETGRKQAFYSVASSDDLAIAVGEKGQIRVSSDGANWEALGAEEFPTIFTFMRDLAFDPSRRVGYIVGQQSRVLRTDDAGKSWQQILGPGGAT